MKQTVKRLFTLVMALAMVCGMLPANALAADTDGELTVVQYSDIVYNPLYEHVETDEDGIATLSDEETVDGGTFTVADAADVLREGMKTRTASYKFTYMPEDGYTQDSLYALLDAAFDQAVEHTGDPVEGDYLRWQFENYRRGYTTYTYSDGTLAKLEMNYTINYYTTEEQEAEVDAAVAALLGNLISDGMTDYDKIKAVYDWMCSNITYDYANLNDDTYKLKYTAYAALIDNTAVCQGYANLLYRLALEMGIDCRLIAGIGNGGAHGWNIVQMDDGLYYNADATWDATWLTSVGYYDYFLRCEENFTDNGTDHIRYEEYDTAAFRSAYPMGTTDYDPATSGSGSGETKETYLASGTCGDNLTWTLDEDYLLTISGSGAMADFASSTQPWEDYTQQITAVVISDGVTSVGDYAFFHCYDIASVELPDSVTSIGMNAFFYCNQLTEIVLPAKLETIGNYAFGSCDKLAEINFPDTLTSIGDKVFSGCAFTSAVLPEGLTSIGTQAFLGCPLSEVYIPASLTAIGDYAFQDCTALPAITVAADNSVYCNDDQGAMYNKDCTTLIVVPGGFVGEFVVPDTVTEIEYNALQNCDELTGVVIPESVTTIGGSAFYDCAKLNNVVLPSSVTAILSFTFAYCEGLIGITIPADITQIGAGAFSNCTALQSITFCGNAPAFDGTYVFLNVKATAYYPAGNTTWTEDVMQNYEGTITWVSYNVYEVTDGADETIATGNELTVRVDAEIDDFVAVYMDGELVAEENYTVTEGSTIITFTAAYLATLPEGEHQITVAYTDGMARTTVTVIDNNVTYTTASISLAGDIGVNYYAQLSDSVAGDFGAYMEFTVAGVKQIVPISEAVVSTDANGGTTYRFSCKVAAKQMTEEIVGQIYLSDGTAVGEAKVYSVKAYCDTAIPAYSQNEDYADLVALMEAMLNYGGYSQVQFGYNTDNLANSGLEDTSLPEITADNVAAYAHGATGSEEGISVASVSLLLESTTTIRFYFKVEEGYDISSYTFYVDGGETAPVESEGLYYVDKVNVAAKDLDEMVTVTVGGLTVKYCGLSYVRQVAVPNPSDFSEALVNVAKALYAYNQAANAYFDQ